MTTIAVPVMAACLLVTTLEVDDGAHSTVATQELGPCDICNKPDCPEPGWMAEARELARVLNEEQKKKVVKR